MVELPILSFVPLQKELVWGGRKLETYLHKPLPTRGPYGESWELVDLPEDQSIVRGGEFDNRSLRTLIQEDEAAILGNAHLLDGHFPLLAKFIDAEQTLSVQVHPDEAACARINAGARPKTEAWYIIDCEPNAKLYVGLIPGTTRSKLKAAIESGTVESLLNVVDATPGEFVFLPAGTIHAIGAGILLAEVQQSSDTTYRVFDWNRMGLDGKPRTLHIEKALEATNFDTVGKPQCAPPRSGRPGVRSNFFEMEAVRLEPGTSETLEGDGPLILMGVAGAGSAAITAHHSTSTMKIGHTRFIPAEIADKVTLSVQNPFTVLSTRITK